ncbi:putative baseplate assembly protein [Paenibacillus lignilyticus]|uniref:Baseplate assembly protein n=1 Tax=Paenibacillus lignilyticus TaxID=1172615 RepID=A0ABS5C5L1_9BACL|nr:putative baseplate assembly protein [Paenibacillus lignilyticus]MBP3961283.1 putative baseplate assembly protein [Paenibacillus lignilyticus]
MLPIPNLDDRRFQQIVEEARKAIPKFMPEWTDENAHDPGITMIELFAWLSEMQQFYINRVPERNQLKFLKLLGAKPQLAHRAHTQVSFQGANRPLMLPKGTKLQAQDQPFETTEPIRLHPARIDRIIVRTDKEANDYTSTNDHVGVSFYAFGPEARQGSRLYIAFDLELMPGDELTMAISLFDDGLVPLIPLDDASKAIVPSAKVSWKFYGNNGTPPELTGAENGQQASEIGAAGSGPSAWMPLELVHDDTVQLMYSGMITFRVPHGMRPVMVHPANDRGRYWFCCTVEQSGYENPPRIEHIAFNTVKAVQQYTFSELFHADLTGGDKDEIIVSSYLAANGFIRVQSPHESGGWIDLLEASDYELQQNIETGEAVVALRTGDGSPSRASLPEQRKTTLRVIAQTETFREQCIIGQSNGLPGQKLVVYDYPLQNDRFTLQIGRRLQDGSWLWEDWTEVDNFDNSTSTDRHFLFDAAEHEIKFGDNERGSVPQACDEPNIWVIACLLGGGTRGNVKPHLITEITSLNEASEQLLEQLTVTNYQFAVGGTEAESLEACIERVRRELHEPFRAVTAEDVEHIVRHTPGLRVARVKALPLYMKGLKDYPRNQAPGQLTVAVVPYSPAVTPTPSMGFRESVRRHLDERRLITTEVHVIAPEYIGITVHAIIVVEPHFVDESKQIVTALNRLLKPLDGRDGSKGWPFGRTVYKGDLFGLMNEMKGVAYIQELWLDAEGQGWTKTSGGDIELPPYGLAYSAGHEIELISRTNL